MGATQRSFVFPLLPSPPKINSFSLRFPPSLVVCEVSVLPLFFLTFPIFSPPPFSPEAKDGSPSFFLLFLSYSRAPMTAHPPLSKKNQRSFSRPPPCPSKRQNNPPSFFSLFFPQGLPLLSLSCWSIKDFLFFLSMIRMSNRKIFSLLSFFSPPFPHACHMVVPVFVPSFLFFG